MSAEADGRPAREEGKEASLLDYNRKLRDSKSLKQKARIKIIQTNKESNLLYSICRLAHVRFIKSIKHPI